MTVNLSALAGAGQQFFDNNGNPLSGGKIYTYQAGTTTPLTTYTTNSGTIAHTNPIVLDAAGRVPSGGEIWLTLGIGYKFVVKTSSEVLIATYDNIPSSAQPPAANDADSIMYEQGYTVTAGSFVIGKMYRIATLGTTDFTLIGAINNVIGTHFIATGVGTGTGTAELSQTVENKLTQTVSVKDFGAVGDGVTDDTAVILAGVAHLKKTGGGTLFFPQGTYKVTDEILIDSPSIRFVGTGRRKPYPGIFLPTANTVSTILPVHSKTAAVRFFNATINTASTFSAQDINFATLETGSMPTCCFGFDGSGNFHRDYTFDRVGVHGFTSAFNTYNTGGDTAFGLIKITNCSINRNGYIARNLTGQWNGFVFENNDAGQQTVGGLHINAQAASIKYNSMEGQPDTIYVNGNYRGVTIEGNYFELNSGSYVVRLRETLGAIVQNNFWQNITATEPLSLVYDVGTIVNDRIIPASVGSFDLKTYQSAINPVPLGGASAAFFADASHIKSMLTGFTELGGYQITPAGPHYAFPESAGNIYTTSGTGLTSLTKTGLSIASGNYIAVAFLLSYQDEPELPPRFELSVNNTNVNGFINPIFYNFNKANQPLKNKTVLYFGVVKATTLCTSLGIRIYPHGLNPAAGLVSYLGLPAIYDLGATVPSVSNVGAGVAAFVPETHVQRANQAPTVGTWPIGYKLHARAPAAAGFEGWICTTAGTPGTWKEFGAILP